ncbi:hypothetical protein BJ138DRAFT_779440 [Hygrophoropsis aurantiaca]|uniref:Uncharacterized protein n=1 Tax=Hygrophoropsis aurantiaca TaxID=72124 RepID=A0ACB7ZX84_9AGAM|nr:hypothetical protein BJ138DRAFT_779440 [Hygrophoropsis aurantiaca]
MSINYIVSQGGVAYGLHNDQIELPHAHNLVEVNVSQATQSNSVQLATHWDAVSTEPENFDQAMAQQYIAMFLQLIEPRSEFQQEGPSLASPEATRVPCRIVSGGLTCEDLIGVTKAEVSRHLRMQHGVNSASRGVTCTWNGGCAAMPMRGDTIARHVVSRHLGTGKVKCRVCGKRFARRDVFKPHAVDGIQCNGTQLEALAV